jgi:hypothetical protein
MRRSALALLIGWGVAGFMATLCVVGDVAIWLAAPAVLCVGFCATWAAERA